MDRHTIQNRPRQQLLDHSSGPKSKPEPTFDFTQNTNVTALIGKTAYLTCRVRNLGDKTVRAPMLKQPSVNRKVRDKAQESVSVIYAAFMPRIQFSVVREIPSFICGSHRMREIRAWKFQVVAFQSKTLSC
jgi:hypothetical protein